ncbi:SGNH/GDSL hydrolase family protein [Metabacillus litoralis]|uniref:SGNH/GDSL hydrolase family protein n=1 Tax=Metabacillus litoralis TaxID=152268 RepID=UPI002041E1EF|nr:SGNH/GDSL hydrolase family protein [Metabacillus litoralis]MCM3655522.1 SGNH/GDSL hydrolase family protein [Metabacillus litoralis]
MRRLKGIVIITSLLVVCFSLYLFLFNSNPNQTKQIALETSNITVTTDEAITDEEHASENTGPEKEEQDGDVSSDIAGKEEEEVVDGENRKRSTLTEDIEGKVREVVEGVIKLFKKDLQVVAIGDSLTQGVGDETKNGGYVGILNNTFEENNIDINIENYGKRGNRTDQLLKRLEKEEIAESIQHADIVFITIGANDIMKIVKNSFTNLHVELFNEEKIEYLERLTAIFHKINEINPDTKIYLVGFYNPFEGYFGDIEELQMIVNDWNESSKSVTEEFENVNYIPTSDLFSHSDIKLLSDDQFHPNTSGYKLMAKRILENMEEVSVEQEVMTEDAE